MDLNNIKKTVSDAAAAAGKTAADTLNRAKVRFALANLQSDLDELYEKLGKLYYEGISTGKSNGTKESAIIAKIDSIKTDMEILKAEVGMAPKKGKVCTTCKRAIPKNASFCPYCGEEL